MLIGQIEPRWLAAFRRTLVSVPCGTGISLEL
jgi:hypothetical protein